VEVSTGLSLAVVVASLGIGITASLLLRPPGADTEGVESDVGGRGGSGKK
jgi:hypothetical protein